ncbi:Hypothetical predicted protein [Lecanosticta acicola]|uniref:Transcription factor Iwr1 domain-containing protein n=1 Tax=Lecanosticta acicola TaxID=111012 RepID=A0AAI9EA73_9PEZI|nr:Hypothetical predicted protein [Lecanosticta acicola]
MSGPAIIKLKRKRDEPAVETLLMERGRKKPYSQSGQDDSQPLYVLQKSEPECVPALSHVGGEQHQGDARASRNGDTRAKAHASGSGSNGTPSVLKRRRFFHLKRPSTPEAAINTRRKMAKWNGIATFMEKKEENQKKENQKKEKRKAVEKFRHGLQQGKKLDMLERDAAEKKDTPPAPQVLKRPGKGAAIRSAARSLENDQGSSSNIQPVVHPKLQEVADSLHSFAVEEAAMEAAPKPRITSAPKLPPQRSLELHRQRASQVNTQTQHYYMDVATDTDDDTDYVYDTYVLASSSGAGAAQVGEEGALGNVGYLVITEEDQAIWETYLEDDPSEKDWDSDEEDENAEDWYGADYPDDELASDDEYNRNAYGYRAHAGSDDEEWDAETGNLSDDEANHESRPWRKGTPQQFSEYFN